MTLTPLTLLGIILLTAIASGALTAFWMHKRFSASVRLHPSVHSAEPEQPPTHTQRTFLDPDFRPVKLAFGTFDGDSPVMEISALEARALPHKKHPLDPSSTKLSTFGPFFQLIPPMLTGAEFGHGNYIRIVVHGPRALASRPESFLPFVHEANGRVERLAGLRNSDQLHQVINGGVVCQLACVIVAQKHITDIDKKLDYIRRGIDEIRKFLINERRSKIAGTLDYLRQVVKTLGRKESPTTLRDQLEQIERELLQYQNQIMRDLGSSAGKIDRIIQGRFKRRKTLVNDINERADEMYELEREWLLCILARTVNWQVLCIFPGDKQFKIARREAIYKSMDGFTGFIQQAYRQLHEKITLVKSCLDSVSMKQQDKSLLVQFDLKRRLLADSGQISSDALAIRGEARNFSDRLWSPQKPIVLALRLDKGRISEAYEI